LVIFIDTSALVKRYFVEEGTREVLGIFEDSYDIRVSAVTKAEAISAFNFRRHRGDISKAEYVRCIDSFFEDFKDFEVVPLSESVESRVQKLAEKYGHKALDNIQLASALVMKPGKFVTSDKKLGSIAELEKLKVKKI
jgi:predicted nucleic acid-binding protein